MKKYNLILAFVILIIGIIISVIIQLERNRIVLSTKMNDINRLLENKTNMIQHELSSSFASVDILRYFFEKDIDVTRKEFQNYTTPIYMENKAIKAISWVPKITHSERLKFESDMKNVLHIQNFSITERDSKNKLKPAAPNEFYFPVKFIEPQSDNFEALGYDIYSDKIRKTTIIESIRKQKLTITAPIILVQDTLGFSFLGIIPVFNNNSSGSSNGMNKVKGLISTVFKVNQIINNALLQSRNSDITLIINDITDKHKEIIFNNTGYIKKNDSIQKRQIHVAGRIWNLEFVIDPSLYKIDNRYSYFLVGLCITLIVFLLLLIPLIKTKKSRILSQQLQAEQEKRKKTEFSLLESENLNKTLVNQLPQNIFIKDTSSTYIICNESYAGNLNISPLNIVGKTDFDFFSIDLAEKYRKDDREVMQNGEIKDIEENYVSQGKESVIHTIKVPYRDINNNVIGIIGIFEDITERKMAEQALQKSEQKFQLLTETAPVGIFRTDPTGKTLYVNPQWCSISGILFNEAIDDGWLNAVHPDDRERLIKKWNEDVQIKAISHSEYRFLLKDGSVVWVVGKSIPQLDKNGDIIGYIGTIIDISERKQAEIKLKESEERYRHLFDNNPVPMLIYDRNTYLLLSINEAFIKQYGYSKDEILSMHLQDLYPEKEKNAIVELAKELHGYAYAGEWHHLLKNGTIITIIATSHDILYTGKNARIAVITDITERKLAEEEIKKANRVYAVLSNINHAIVHVQDKITLYNEVCRIAVQDGKFVMAWIGIVDENSTKVIPVASNGFTDGYLENINIDLRDSKLSHGPTGQTVQSGFHTIANDIANNPEMIPWRDNALKLGYKSSASFPIIVFGKTIGAFMIYSNESFFFNDVELKLFDEITVNISFAVEFIENEMKRKQDELEIYRLNNHLQNLIEVVQNLTLARSMDEIMNSVMSAARNLTEADGVTFVLRDGDQCNYLNEDAIGPLWKGQKFPLEKCISGWTMLNRELVIIEDIYEDTRIPHEAYRTTFVKSLAMIPIRTKNPVGAIGVYWATNHRPTDEQMIVIQTLADATAIAMENLSFYNELDAKVKERTILLEATNNELEAFSYSVSHDLRAPLRHITGYIDLLNRRFPDALPENGKHYLNNISKSAIQMGILIDDLLQFSRTGRQEIQMEKLNMNLLVQDVIKLIKFEIKEREINWVVSALPDVWGDNNLMKQVWINLLSNAAKFTRKKELPKIEIACVEEENEFIFYVRDNGAGFDMQYSQKLFGVFQRLHSADDYEGTGVGLANVQRIIARHGGRIWAKAEIEKGATFYFALPINKKT